MKHALHHLRSVLAAVAILALTAGLAFGATPPDASWGLANAASHAGKTVPVAGAGDTLEEDETEGDEESESEDVDEEEEAETEDELAEDGENCATDPTLATEEELAELNHGSIVCWAAHQTEWPEWFANHGQWVRCWAHQGKADATSCTEDPNAEESEGEGEEEAVEASASETRGPGHGKGKGNGKGKGKAGRD